jgi:hypothetical protein
MNILVNKKIIENWNNPEILTNGDFLNYSGVSGFSYALWPETLTYDLESTHKLFCIRFLLWDNLGSKKTVRSDRKYRYRLLTSIDGNIWTVHFDTGKEGYNGWQQFIFDDLLEVRYIKLHALHNSANGQFHIVEFQAFDCVPPNVDADIIVDKHFSTNSNNKEIGDGLPITGKITAIAIRLKNIVEQNSLLNPEPFNKIISDILVQAKDIKVIEGNIDSIKRVILDPVEIELKKSAKIGKYSVWGFVIGLIGIIVSIATIIIGAL